MLHNYNEQEDFSTKSSIKDSWVGTSRSKAFSLLTQCPLGSYTLHCPYRKLADKIPRKELAQYVLEMEIAEIELLSRYHSLCIVKRQQAGYNAANKHQSFEKR